MTAADGLATAPSSPGRAGRAGRRTTGGRPRGRRRPGPAGRRSTAPACSGRAPAAAPPSRAGAESRSPCDLAQVVGVRLGVGRERADDGGLVGVDVGQRGDRGTAARGARATPDRTHGATVPPPSPSPLRLAGATTARGVSFRPSRGAARAARRTRDRRGRGMRGPAIAPSLPGPPGAAHPRRAVRRAGRSRSCRDIDTRWQDRLGLVEYAVEDTPQLPDDWSGETVPLSSLVRGSGATPTRLVLFRRPIEHRCETPRRPRGDGAHRRGRAGRRAARHRRRGRRPALLRATTTGSSCRGQSARRDLGHEALGQQLGQREDGRPVAARTSTAPRTGGALRHDVDERRAARQVHGDGAALLRRRRSGAAARLPEASYAVTRAEPAASADEQQPGRDRVVLRPRRRSRRGAGWPPPAATSSSGTVRTRSLASAVSSEAVTGRVGLDGDAQRRRPPGPVSSACGQRHLGPSRPGGTDTGVEPVGREAGVAGDDLDLGPHHVVAGVGQLEGAVAVARAAGRAARWRRRARADAAATRSCVWWVARSVEESRTSTASRPRDTTHVGGEQRSGAGAIVPRSRVTVLCPGIVMPRRRRVLNAWSPSMVTSATAGPASGLTSSITESWSAPRADAGEPLVGARARCSPAALTGAVPERSADQPGRQVVGPRPPARRDRRRAWTRRCSPTPRLGPSRPTSTEQRRRTRRARSRRRRPASRVAPRGRPRATLVSWSGDGGCVRCRAPGRAAPGPSSTDGEQGDHDGQDRGHVEPRRAADGVRRRERDALAAGS